LCSFSLCFCGFCLWFCFVLVCLVFSGLICCCV
jgi:hypothetical protein